MDSKKLLGNVTFGNFAVSMLAGVAVVCIGTAEAVIAYTFFGMAQFSAMLVFADLLDKKRSDFEPEILEWKECRFCDSEICVSYYSECSGCGEKV